MIKLEVSYVMGKEAKCNEAMLQLPQLLSSLLSNHNRHDFSSLQHLKSIARWKTYQSFGELDCLSHQNFSLGTGDRFIWGDSFSFS
ncbi:hypothetical protein CDAR_205441 [Caerostris darwini]|uniref:Uncharacterized protein n=1 Tax=Caerostris darwini TaxID=1538125 RepID=A0AAV4WSX8_9ARAC|nr:hypothetical protein CDAR_205441 [Caerostris darwini]